MQLLKLQHCDTFTVSALAISTVCLLTEGFSATDENVTSYCKTFHPTLTGFFILDAPKISRALNLFDDDKIASFSDFKIKPKKQKL